MPNIFDDRGVIIQGIDEIRTAMADEAKIKFAPELEGRPLRTDDSSTIGRLFAMTAKPAVQNAEILPLIFQALDINSAEGQQLDNLLWNIHRIKRKDISQANGLLMLYGRIGTLVASGSEVGNSITGDTYQTDSNVTFSNVSVNGVDLGVSSVGGTYTLNYTIDGYLSQSPDIVIVTGSQDTTIKQIADRFVDAINSQSSYLTASRNNDNTVKVIITDQSMVGTFITTGNVGVVNSYSSVYATATTYGSQDSKANQITSIKTSVYGWLGVTNPFYIFSSSGVELDEDYRYRGKLKQQNSSGKHTSILMALKSVRGVVYENVQANTSINATTSGIVNNGLSITAMGGNEDDIALAIFNSVSDGILTSGNIVKQVKDINGFPHEVRFSRPSSKAIQISMSLVTYPDFPNNGYALIKQSIVDWFNKLNVGEDIYYSRLYEPINDVRGFAVRNLKFGYRGGTLGVEDITILHNELATISAEDISIGGR